jgi:hypothetical protein
MNSLRDLAKYPMSFILCWYFLINEGGQSLSNFIKLRFSKQKTNL